MQTEQHITGARKVVVGFWEGEFERVGEAWVTEATWNGFAIPHFERGELVKALEYLSSESMAMRMDGDVLVVEPEDDDAFTIEPNPVWGTYDLGPLGYTFDTEHELPAAWDWDTVMLAEPAQCPCCGASREQRNEHGFPLIGRRVVAPIGVEPMATLTCGDCERVVWSMPAPALHRS